MKAPAIIALVLGLVVVFGFMGKALWDIGGLQGLTAGHPDLGIAIGIAIVGAGGLAAVLMRLAFYSSRKGYDEIVRFEDPTGDAED